MDRADLSEERGLLQEIHIDSRLPKDYSGFKNINP
jgi:hypothetical protein